MQITRKLAAVFTISLVAFFGTQNSFAQSSIGQPVVLIDYSTSPVNYTITEACANPILELLDGLPEFALQAQQLRDSIGLTYNLHDEFQEAQEFFNVRFAGYRDDIPRVVRENVEGALVFVQFEAQSLGGPLASALPLEVYRFQGSSFNVFNTSSGVRPWAFTRLGLMTINTDFLCLMLATNEFVPTIVHEAMHAIGFGSLFEDNGLNGNNFFGVRNYQFEGFALAKYRQEAQIPFASFIPLQPNIRGHWDPNDPFFNQVANGLRDVMHPVAAPPGWTIFYSETTWSVFADLGYKVRGVNAPLGR